MDRDQRDQLAVLADRAADLEDLARKIQAEQDEDAAATNLRQLEVEYLTWQSAVMQLLPEDLRDAFSFEYEGNFSKVESVILFDQAAKRTYLGKW